MLVIQSGIEKHVFSPVALQEKVNFLDEATVLAINTSDDTLELTTSGGIDLNHVPMIRPSMYDGVVGVNDSSNRVGISADIELPPVGSTVIVGFLNNNASSPVVLGCLQEQFLHRYATADASSNDVGKKFYLHRSGYWEKIDSVGNFETYLPDGTTISVSSTIEGANIDGKLSYEDRYKLPKAATPAKTTRIKHPSGTTIMIKSDGTVVIKAAKIELGDDREGSSSDGIVLGSKFRDIFNNHIHPTGIGPSGVPIPQPTHPSITKLDTDSHIIDITG